MIKTPSVTVVIANYNGTHDLEKCLASIKTLRYPHLAVVVFDNASANFDLVRLQKKFRGVRFIVFKKNYGFAAGYNRVLKNIISPFVFIANNDTIFTRSLIKKMVAYARISPDVAIIQPKIVAMRDRKSFEYAGAAGGYVDKLGYPYCRGRILFRVEKDRGQYDKAADIFWASGTAMFCRTKVIKQTGLFDVDLVTYVEENDLCWRVLRAGYRIVCLPKAVIVHKGMGSWEKKQLQKTYLIHRNNLLVSVKHLTLSRLVIVLAIRFFLDYLAALYYFLRGYPQYVPIIFLAHLGFLAHFPKFWRKRTPDKSGREREIEKTLMKPTSIVLAYYLFGKKKYSDL